VRVAIIANDFKMFFIYLPRTFLHSHPSTSHNIFSFPLRTQYLVAITLAVIPTSYSIFLLFFRLCWQSNRSLKLSSYSSKSLKTPKWALAASSKSPLPFTTLLLWKQSASRPFPTAQVAIHKAHCLHICAGRKEVSVKPVALLLYKSLRIHL
jgi:hypothetical protein